MIIFNSNNNMSVQSHKSSFLQCRYWPSLLKGDLSLGPPPPPPLFLPAAASRSLQVSCWASLILCSIDPANESRNVSWEFWDVGVVRVSEAMLGSVPPLWSGGRGWWLERSPCCWCCCCWDTWNCDLNSAQN